MASAPPAPRLFLALWPDDAARKGLARWRDRWAWPSDATPTRTDKLHLTLHFIGAVPADRLEALAAALPGAAAADAFTLEFGRPELWQGGLAVVCPLATPEPLRLLHSRLATALRGLTLPLEERPFRPHVTLARKARQATVPADGPQLEWHVGGGFALVQSMPAGQGYRILQRVG